MTFDFITIEIINLVRAVKKQLERDSETLTEWQSFFVLDEKSANKRDAESMAAYYAERVNALESILKKLNSGR